MLRYAGIGHRCIDAMYEGRARSIAERLGSLGFVLRSGGATGADRAFADGAGEDAREIILPWAGYNNVSGAGVAVLAGAQYRAVSVEASKAHSGWARCRVGAKRLLSRNAAIVLGVDLDEPVDVVVCVAQPEVVTAARAGPPTNWADVI